jgi:hypothetical protein
MTEISPLRRRMIEDMTVRNMSPATLRPSDPTCMRWLSLAASSVACRSGWVWRRSAPFRSTLSLAAYHASAEPDRLRASVPVWCDAQAGGVA